MCNLKIYLREGSGDKSRDYTNVQSLNLTTNQSLKICHNAPVCDSVKQI